MQQPTWVPIATGKYCQTPSVTSLLSLGGSGVIPLSWRPCPQEQQETRKEQGKREKGQVSREHNSTKLKLMGHTRGGGGAARERQKRRESKAQAKKGNVMAPLSYSVDSGPAVVVSLSCPPEEMRQTTQKRPEKQNNHKYKHKNETKQNKTNQTLSTTLNRLSTHQDKTTLLRYQYEAKENKINRNTTISHSTQPQQFAVRVA